MLVEFNNVGRVPVPDVTLLIEQASPLLSPVPGSVVVFNGNHPDGFSFRDDAVQNAGRQVNIQIGDYGGRTNAYIELRYAIDFSASVLQCGTHTFTVSAYGTPAGRGSIFDSTEVRWSAGAGC